jgi:DNA-binding MurR/RpiR family transcriptional regulator
MKQEGMTENESRIVEWLLKPGNLSDAPAIKDVAEALSVSEAMIVKVSKLLGFSGFRNLRSALVEYFSQSEQVLPAELSFDEAPQDVVNKVFNITLRTIMEGQSIVNVDEIHRAARFSPRPTSAICTARADQMPSAPMCSISFYASACAARHIRTRIS